MSFNEYYEKEIRKYGGDTKYVIAKAREKKPLIDRILKYLNDGNILEAGAGSSSNSIYLASNGLSVTAVDKDQRMIKLAKKLSLGFKNSPIFLNKDLSEINEKFSVVFSHGVLEHFSDEEIIDLLNKEISIGRTVIFSVPSNFFKKEQAINGDERFLSLEKWREIISKTNGKIVEEFSYFYDPDNLKLKILKTIFKLTGGVMPIKKPYIGFVLQKNVHSS
ncbi:MAG: methyltransferase domain-containing protein [Nanoarchaeota archaeon]|nr:methyltransferase domain-containing protein [Nanoarchaeota archaeon]